MSEVVHGAPAFPRSDGGEHLVDLSHRYLVPATALTSFFLGLALLLYPLTSVGVFVPFALVAIGLGALVSSLSWRRRRTLPATDEPAPTARVPTVSTGSVPSTRPGKPFSEKGSEWRVLCDATGPGDETWISWLPRERRRLGPEGSSFASGVVHSPGKAGNLVAFPVRNYHHGIRFAIGSGEIPDSRPLNRAPSSPREGNGQPMPTPATGKRRDGPSRPPRTAHPLTEEELDRMFPPFSDHGPVLMSDVPDRIGGRAQWASPLSLPDDPSPSPEGHPRSAAPFSSARVEPTDRMLEGVSLEDGRAERSAVRGRTSSDRSGSVALRPLSDVPPNELILEAANPVPPHLREAGPRDNVGPHRPAHRSSELARERTVCASCSKVVMNLRMSGPCPKCLRPICSDCLREAFSTHGHGWCVDCSCVLAANGDRGGRLSGAVAVGFRDPERRSMSGPTLREAPEPTA